MVIKDIFARDIGANLQQQDGDGVVGGTSCASRHAVAAGVSPE
jgi:hypothetical protein